MTRSVFLTFKNSILRAMDCRRSRGTSEPVIGIAAVTQKKVPKGGEIGISDGDAVTAATAFLLGDLLELSVSVM